MKKPSLVPDWKESWRWFSMQANGLLVAMGVTWTMIPESARSEELVRWGGAAFGVIAALGAIGRLIDQKGKTDADQTGA